MIQMNEHTFTLKELAAMVDMPRRTVRYYIQIELIDRPNGLGRGAHYTTHHLEQLIEIRKWQRAGLSLDRIRELLAEDDTPIPLPSMPRKSGSIEIRSHVMISDGIELTIDPKRSGLTPQQISEFVEGVTELFEKNIATKER